MINKVLILLDALFLLFSAMMVSFAAAIFLDSITPSDFQIKAPYWLAWFISYIFVPGVVVFFASWTIWSIVRVRKRRREINIQK